MPLLCHGAVLGPMFVGVENIVSCPSRTQCGRCGTPAAFLLLLLHILPGMLTPDDLGDGDQRADRSSLNQPVEPLDMLGMFRNTAVNVAGCELVTGNHDHSTRPVRMFGVLVLKLCKLRNNHEKRV